MRLEDLQESINSILLFNQQPELLIIHCGGNEIGPRSILDIYNHYVCIVGYLQQLLPGTTLVFSAILPRISWRSIDNNKTANKCRHRLNSRIAALFLEKGGCYIKYPDIVKSPTLFKSDDTCLDAISCWTLCPGQFIAFCLSKVVFPDRFEFIDICVSVLACVHSRCVAEGPLPVAVVLFDIVSMNTLPFLSQGFDTIYCFFPPFSGESVNTNRPSLDI